MAVWKSGAGKTADGLPKVSMDGIAKASANLVAWSLKEEWTPLLWDVHMDHLESVAETFEGDEDDLFEALGDYAGVLSAFVAEDFFGARFGEHGELNVIDDYLKQCGSRESEEGRLYLEALRDSMPSLYEVIDIEPGRCMTLRNLLVEGEEVTVFEQSGSQGAALWDRIAARIVVVNGKRLFTGAVLHFRHEVANIALSAFDEIIKKSKRELRKKGRRAAASIRRRKTLPPMTREAIIRNLPCAQILSHFWLSDTLAQLQAPLPELRNSDDELFILCEVRFPIVGDMAKISSALDEIAVFERIEDGETAWVWRGAGSPSQRLSQTRKGNPAAEPEEDSTFTRLGDIDIEPGAVVLRVNSKERAGRCQALLSSQLGDLVGKSTMTSQDPREILKAGADRPEPDDIEPPSEEAQQAIHAVLDDHYRSTLDAPLPFLGGRTLRQAAKTKTGRDEVINWLKGLENAQHRKAARDGEKVYDTSWIWKELDIERFR